MWFLERWLENPATVKKMFYLLYLSFIIVCLIGIVNQFAPSDEYEAHAEHAPFVFEKIPIFNAIFGFVMCALLGLGAKAYGHNIVMKEEDYYDR
jgi:cell division protein FtsW (lipid II flippase)